MNVLIKQFRSSFSKPARRHPLADFQGPREAILQYPAFIPRPRPSVATGSGTFKARVKGHLSDGATSDIAERSEKPPFDVGIRSLSTHSEKQLPIAVMTQAEVALWLGVSRHWVRRHIRPTYGAGKRCWFDRDDVLSQLELERRKPCRKRGGGTSSTAAQAVATGTSKSGSEERESDDQLVKKMIAELTGEHGK
ncbi:MAG: helix-turn-helix domain-containing protein [Deltaproteobacteria bacterium]|nr:helix-turn-helix domain-containing protein [Deltaproteobacteria bacterium]